MPVEVVVRNEKFYNEFKNDVGFVSNLGDYTINMTGNLMENIKYTCFVDVSWNSLASDTSGNWSIQFLGGFDYRFKKNDNSSFDVDGFSVDDVIDWHHTTGGVTTVTEGLISSMTSTWIYITMVAAPYTITSIETTGSSKFYGKSDLTASTYSFGVLENSETFGNISKVSNNSQGYYTGGIGDRIFGVRDTSFIPMIKLGNFKDWVTGVMRIRYVSDPYTYFQRFEIEHEFTIVPFVLDGQLSNLQSLVPPALMSGNKSLKYSFSPNFRTGLNNPNTEKSIKIDKNLGSVGWFNEPFNGFNLDYEVLSVSYTEDATGNSATGLLISGKTNVSIDVQNNAGNFTAGERGGVYVSYLPKVNEYQNTIITDLKENFLYDNAINSEGIAPVVGQDFITNFEITNVVTNTMTLTFDVEYSLAQQVRLAGQNSQSPIYFLLGVQLGDVTITSVNSNRVIMLADAQPYDSGTDIAGLMSFPKMDFYTPEKLIGTDVGTTNVTSWIEDGLAIDYSFQLDLNKDAVLNSLDCMIVAFDPVTQIYFEIDKYTFNIFPAIVSGGVQQLNANTTRGYPLEIGDQFNEVFMQVSTNTLGFQDYNGRIGQKISWQDWIANLGVDTTFYDATQPNDNMNNKASNYSLLKGYEIRLAFFGNLSGTSILGISGLTDYIVLSPTLTIYNYEEDGGFNVWSHVIETFDATGTNNLGGSILTGQDTLFRSTWTNSGGAVTSLVDLWGFNRIEETGQPGYEIVECNTIKDTPAGQILKPSTGLRLDMQIVGGLVVMECLIDGSVATSGTAYNLSTRIQDDNAIPIGGKITEQGVLKDTEVRGSKNNRMIVIEQSNLVPYTYGSGNAGKLQGAALPEIPTSSTNDICICDFVRCEYSERVFASPSNPNDYWKNDQNEFLFKRFVAVDTIALELHKAGVKVADLNDGTYGTFYNGFASGSSEQQLYVGYLLDWLTVYNAFGGGSYTVVANLDIIGNTSVETSRKFLLSLYNDVSANNTVRIETTQNGNIFGSQFDFTGLNWYQSLRLPANFGNPSPIFETSEYKTSKHLRRQNKAIMGREWELKTGLIPWEVADKLVYNKMLGNSILITDYTIKAESIWRRVKVFMQEIEKPEITKTPVKVYNIKFTDVEDKYTKRNF